MREFIFLFKITQQSHVWKYVHASGIDKVGNFPIHTMFAILHYILHKLDSGFLPF